MNLPFGNRPLTGFEHAALEAAFQPTAREVVIDGVVCKLYPSYTTYHTRSHMKNGPVYVSHESLPEYQSTHWHYEGVLVDPEGNQCIVVGGHEGKVHRRGGWMRKLTAPTLDEQ